TIVLRCLGTFDVTIDSAPVTAFPTDKARALLAYLALESRAGEGTQGARPHRREALASLFWPEQAEASAMTNLRVTLYRLRQVLDQALPGASAAALLITRQTVQLNQAELVVDATRFQTLLAESAAHPHIALHRCDTCLARLDEAAELYRGEL